MIALITEWQNHDGKVERRDEKSNLGGTMRLGAQPAIVKTGTLAHRIYGKDIVAERHRHRYEVNNHYVLAPGSGGPQDQRQDQGRGPHRDRRSSPTTRGSWACSTTRSSPPRRATGHPLFKSFIKAALEQHKLRVPEPALKVIGGRSQSNA